MDTTRVFSLLSWGVLVECIIYSYELSIIKSGKDGFLRNEMMKTLVVIGIIAFITPRYYSWYGEIHPTPFYDFIQRLIHLAKHAQ
jgi:hypothetical protein